jgi:dnd system-associated protein 4
MSRIHRDKKHDQIIERLTKGEDAIFTEIWRVLVLAAFIGARKNLRSPVIESDAGKAFPLNYIQPSCGPGFIYLLGISSTENNQILRSKEGNQDELIQIFSEYANAGLELITQKANSTSAPLEAILLLLEEENRAGEDFTTVGLI